MTRQQILIVILFVTAASLRFADVFRPINHPSWRECDLGSVARNFAIESMDPLYPAIDWRGDGPGFAEMELPLYPWLTAATYKVFGVHDEIGRVWAFIFSIGTLFLFWALAREYLTAFPATIAFAFFALNPLLVDKSTAIQPEGLMMLAYVAAVLFFLRWLKTERRVDYWFTVAMTAMTLLAKAPSAHIGLFFGVLLFQKYGWKVLRESRVWLFGVLSLLPASLWYFHAKNLWLVYGNSLGVSNEYHWIGLDFFTDPHFAEGILASEFFYVWVTFGLVVGLFAIWRGWREDAAKHSLLWLASIFAMYLVAARTTSQGWASYYHVFSIPPVALIFGLSIKKLWDYAGEFSGRYSSQAAFTIVRKVIVMAVVIFAILASLGFEAKQIRGNFLDRRLDDPDYLFAQRVRPLMIKPGLIIVSGGRCRDDRGHPLADNASYMFYWLDRKGWNTCVEDQTITTIQKLRAKGAVYFVAERQFVQNTPGFIESARAAYPVIAESTDFTVFDISGAAR